MCVIQPIVYHCIPAKIWGGGGGGVKTSMLKYVRHTADSLSFYSTFFGQNTDLLQDARIQANGHKVSQDAQI